MFCKTVPSFTPYAVELTPQRQNLRELALGVAERSNHTHPGGDGVCRTPPESYSHGRWSRISMISSPGPSKSQDFRR